MTPDAYAWPGAMRHIEWLRERHAYWSHRAVDLAAENTRLRQQIADLETEANTLAATLQLAATLIRPNRESQ